VLAARGWIDPLPHSPLAAAHHHRCHTAINHHSTQHSMRQASHSKGCSCCCCCCCISIHHICCTVHTQCCTSCAAIPVVIPAVSVNPRVMQLLLLLYCSLGMDLLRFSPHCKHTGRQAQQWAASAIVHGPTTHQQQHTARTGFLALNPGLCWPLQRAQAHKYQLTATCRHEVIRCIQG